MEDETQDGQLSGLTTKANRWAGPIKWVSLLLIVAALFVLLRTLPLETGVRALKDWIEAMGPTGMVVYGLIYVVATVLLLPGTILTVAAGALFGLAWATITVSLSSTAGAALAFLIARYLGRGRLSRKIKQYPKFDAIDQAIGEGGWKIVALLRLSPAIPFNLQNYLYGLTRIRFLEAVLASWAAMLPGTFMYVYFGYIGRAGVTAAAEGDIAGAGLWILRIAGLLATVAVTVYVTRLASRALKRQTKIGPMENEPKESAEVSGNSGHRRQGWPWGATIALFLALLATGTAAVAQLNAGLLQALFGPPPVELKEAYEPRPGGRTFDHSLYDKVLRKHVDDQGWIDYEALLEEPKDLNRYLEALAIAPFDALGRDQKLALLINAYNAFTLALILDHYPLASIKEIPASKRWDDERWQIGDRVWSLNQIEHQQIRPKFIEPRIHFALVCAAVGCPILRNEAYLAERIDHQLDDQAYHVHRHERWFRHGSGAGTVHLTELYDWYRGDFEQVARSVLHYAAHYAEDLKHDLDAGQRPQIRWLKYDWSLNDVKNRPDGPGRAAGSGR